MNEVLKITAFWIGFFITVYLVESVVIIVSHAKNTPEITPLIPNQNAL